VTIGIVTADDQALVRGGFLDLVDIARSPAASGENATRRPSRS